MKAPALSLRPTSPSLPVEASIRNLPVSLFAAVMGLCGLAIAWRLAQASLGAPAAVGEALGAFALGVFALLSAGYLAKLLRHPKAVLAEFHHPVTGNFFGTVVIAILLVSAVVEPYAAGAARGIWTVGVVATLALSYVSVSRLLKGQIDPSHALPAWIIPCVATLDIPVTGAHMPMAWAAEINLLACAIGAAMALALFVMIVSRLAHRDPLPPGMAPSLMILVAPFAVGFLAYVDVVGGIDRFAALLFHFGWFLFAVVAPKVFRRGVPFSPTWWAVGFPMAALANASLRYAQFRDSAPLCALAIALLAALTLTLAVLGVRTAQAALDGRLFK